MIFLRSLVFLIAQILVTPPYAIFALATFPLPRLARYRIISGWSRAMIWLAKNVLGIHYRVIGMENLPQTPSVILSKHQSAWETLAFQLIFPPQVLVLKRELLWIPFFGWGLALTSPIAIDRRRGVRALNRMVVPVAHNAGLFWGRKAFLKHPGTVTVEVGPPIDSHAHTPESLNLSVEKWIEGRMANLCPRR